MPVVTTTSAIPPTGAHQLGRMPRATTITTLTSAATTDTTSAARDATVTRVKSHRYPQPSMLNVCITTIPYAMRRSPAAR